MKRCFKCGVEKPIGEFYAHAQMADGHLNKCKGCTKHDMKVDRRTKPQVREYDRRRAALPHRKASARRVTKAWRAKHPERAGAQAAAAKALSDGKLARRDRCETCDMPVRLEKHHHDYSRPLLVMWLCKPCHAIADKLRRFLEAS